MEIPKTTTNKVDHSFINKLPTFQQRGKAIASRLASIKADPRYQKLSPDKQAKVRADLYDKHVPVAYQGFKYDVPDKKTWVEASAGDTSKGARGFELPGSKSTSFKGSFQKKSSIEEFVNAANLGADKAISGLELFGIKVANKAFSKMAGLDSYFTHNSDGWLSKAIVNGDKYVKQTLQNQQNAAEHRIQSDDFWLQTHPRDTIIGKLGSMSGEVIATLPLYEAIGAMGVGAKILGTAGKVGEVAKIGAPLGEAFGPTKSLTNVLQQSPIGKFVAKRFINATDVYLASFAESGGSASEARSNAISGASLETAGIPLAKGTGKLIKIAAAPLIKKWTANTIAMGGKPFAEDLMQSAATEVKYAHDWFMRPASVQEITFGKSYDLIHGIRVHPETEGTGHFSTSDGQIYKYSGKQHQQQVFNQLVKTAEETRLVHDPVMAKLHEAEKNSLESIAISKFKMGMGSITKEQKLEVLGERWMQIQQAAQEAPVHLPELEKEQVASTIMDERKANSVFNELASQMEKLGIKIEDAVTENNIEAVAKETGISNTDAAASKLVKNTKPFRSVGADLNRYQDARKYSIAYYRAPRNRTKFIDTITSMKVGNFNKFYEYLKDAMGSSIKFETPRDMMLYHYGMIKSMPEEFQKPMKSALLTNLKKISGFENKTAKEIGTEAAHFHNHMYDLAQSGRLGSEGNVFASTRASGPMGWTKYQAILAKESDAEVIKVARAALQRHPEALKGFDATVARLQKLSFKAKTPEEYLAYKKAIAESSTNIVQHISDKKLGGIIQ